MSSKILCVDDDANLLAALQRTLRKQFSFDTVTRGAEGLRLLAEKGPYAVVVADMQMPEMNGLEFLKQVETLAPDSVRIMLTGNADQKTAINAVNDGHVFRFLTKPCPSPTLISTLEAGLKQHRLIIAERELLENTLSGAVNVLTEILSMADPYTFDQSQRLKEYVKEFTQASDLPAAWELEMAAMLSQIGRITIPQGILAKVRSAVPLTGPEQDILNGVPEVGARLLESIPRLENVAQIVRFQEKHFDGTGLPTEPFGGDDIPFGARILKVLNDIASFEDKSVSKAAALQRMQKRAGWYDPAVLTAACRCFDIAVDVDLENRPPPQPMSIETLRQGQIIAEDIRTNEGLLIATAESELSSMILQKLLNFRSLKTIDETILVHCPVEQSHSAGISGNIYFLGKGAGQDS